MSLSGGADSSTVATLVHLLVQFGTRELGHKRLLHEARPSLIAPFDETTAGAMIVHRLLTCVYQSTRNSGTHDSERGEDHRRRRRRRVLRVECRRHGRRVCAHRIARRSAANLPGNTMTSRCRTFRPAPAAPASGYSPIFATHCCSRPAIAAKPLSATRQWTATPAAASRRSLASTKRTCSIGSNGWKRSAPPASVRCRLSQPSPASARPPSYDPRSTLRPMKATSCRIACSTRSSGPPFAISSCRSKCSKSSAHNSLSTTFNKWARGSSDSSASGAATNGSASATPRHSISTTRTSTPKPWCRFPILNSGFEKELAELRDYVQQS